MQISQGHTGPDEADFQQRSYGDAFPTRVGPRATTARHGLGPALGPTLAPGRGRIAGVGLGGPRPAGAAPAAVTSRRCSERACSHRRQPVPATRRKEGTGRSRWYCGKWQEREAGTHLEAPRPRCRASCGGGGGGGHPSKCCGGGGERPRRRLPEWPAETGSARKVRGARGTW